MNILITGGGGFIGTHVALEALENNYEVTILDNFSSSDPKYIDRVSKIVKKELNIVNGDIQNRNLVSAVLKSNDIDLVIHLAAHKSVEESVEEPLKYYENNIYGSLVLLQEMIKANVNKLIFSSTAAVYGFSKEIPIKEITYVDPQNPYSRSKLYIETLIEDLSKSNQSFQSIILRYFNPVGSNKSYLIGESPKIKAQNLFPKLCKVLGGEREYIEVYGNDYSTPDGTGIRDFIHIEDLATGHISSIDYLLSENYSSVPKINLGTGKGYSVLEVIKMFEKVSGKKINYEVMERRKGDVDVSYADPSLAKKLLNWKSQYDLEDMCRDSWNWYLKNLKKES